MQWIRVADSKLIKDGEMLDFDYGDYKLLISKAKGKLYATDRICTHAYADLAIGILNEEEQTVTCPLHLSAFKLDTGQPQNLPAEQPLGTYNVKIQDSQIYVELDSI